MGRLVTFLVIACAVMLAGCQGNGVVSVTADTLVGSWDVVQPTDRSDWVCTFSVQNEPAMPGYTLRLINTDGDKTNTWHLKLINRHDGVEVGWAMLERRNDQLSMWTDRGQTYLSMHNPDYGDKTLIERVGISAPPK